MLKNSENEESGKNEFYSMGNLKDVNKVKKELGKLFDAIESEIDKQEGKRS